MKRGQSSKIKAVIFDIGGVLALSTFPINSAKNHHLGAHEQAAKQLNISLDQYFDSIDSIYSRSIEGTITKKQVIRSMSANLNISKKKLEKLFVSVYKKMFKQNKRLYSFAFNLRKKGYKIAILSDQWHLSKEALMPKNLVKHFDEVIVSCDIGMRKPNKKIFILILKKLKIRSENALFVDNQNWNINAAKKIGMNAILYKNNNQLFSEIKKFL